MSTPLDTPMDTDPASPHPRPRPRDPLTLLTTVLAQYPIIRLLATHLHHTDLVKLMLTSRAIYHTIAPSRTAIKPFTCGGATQRTFGCWCCGVPVCPYCCYEVFLPWVLAPDTHWPTEDDKKYNDKSIRNPACRYEFSDAKRCCLRCYRKPAWWVKEKYQERWGCVFGKKDEGGHQARDVRESIYFSPFGRGSFTLHGANWWEEEISVLHNSSP